VRVRARDGVGKFDWITRAFWVNDGRGMWLAWWGDI